MGKKATVKIECKALQELIPHPLNPRDHPDPGSAGWETLKRSLAHDYFDPIVFNKRNGMLVSGHLRVKVLDELGFTEADAVIVDYDERTHLARMVAANKQQGWNNLPRLKDILQDLDAGDLDMEALTGWSMAEVEKLMNQFHVPDPDPEPKKANRKRTTLHDELQFNTDHLVKQISDYVAVTECECKDGVQCWHCLFEYALNHYEASRSTWKKYQKGQR
jgi:ParB-like chromosome segregation protein Spo0J